MIKAIHKTMRKKGFTMVELIVVIAIIGVLAAVLIPTLMGMVIKAKVTSANKTASEIRKHAGAFMIDAEVVGFCMKQSQDMVEVFNITVQDSTWECSSAADPGHFNKLSGINVEWGKGGAQSRYTAGTNIGTLVSGEKFLCVWLSRLFPNLTDASVVIAFKGGTCTFAAFSPDRSTALDSTECPAITNGEPPANFIWNGKMPGVAPTGSVVGTSPAVGLS